MMGHSLNVSNTDIDSVVLYLLIINHPSFIILLHHPSFIIHLSASRGEGRLGVGAAESSALEDVRSHFRDLNSYCYSFFEISFVIFQVFDGYRKNRAKKYHRTIAAA